MTRIFGAALLACLLPIAAAAQTSDGPALDLSAAQPSQGPMTVQKIHNGFLAAPDFKILWDNAIDLYPGSDRVDDPRATKLLGRSVSDTGRRDDDGGRSRPGACG